MTTPNPNYVSRVLEIAERKHADNPAVASIASQLREIRDHAMRLRRDPGERLQKIREISAGTSAGIPMMSVETALVDDLLLELDAHRRVGVIAMLLSRVLADIGEDMDF